MTKVSARSRRKFHGMRRKPKIGRKKKSKSNWDGWHKKKHGGMNPIKDAGKAWNLTERQKQIFLYIRLFQYRQRYSPNTTDVQHFFGISRTAAFYHVCKIVEKGYLEVKGRINAPQFLFPKNMQFPWEDLSQFPKDIFDPPEGYVPPSKHDNAS